MYKGFLQQRASCIQRQCASNPLHSLNGHHQGPWNQHGPWKLLRLHVSKVLGTLRTARALMYLVSGVWAHVCPHLRGHDPPSVRAKLVYCVWLILNDKTRLHRSDVLVRRGTSENTSVVGIFPRPFKCLIKQKLTEKGPKNVSCVVNTRTNNNQKLCHVYSLQFSLVHQIKTHPWRLTITAGPKCLAHCGRDLT